LPPDVPDFRTSQRLLTKVHQIVATTHFRHDFEILPLMH
jgi:hypothetical protein